MISFRLLRTTNSGIRAMYFGFINSPSILYLILSTYMTAFVVTSAPVPAVVGIANKSQ